MQAKWLGGVISGLALVFAAGCPQLPGEPERFGANLDGGQEVPPVETNGSGTGIFELNGNVLSFEVMASGLTGPLSAAHFHNAPAGQDGGVIFDLGPFIVEENGDITIEGEWTLDAAEMALLEDGNLYVNLHTQQFPDGEIRGQVEPLEAE